MLDSPSEKRLVLGLNAGSASAVAKLNQQYRAKLCALVEREMGHRLRRREDPEDVVQSVLWTVARRAAKGQLHIDCGGQLWRLLEKVARRKLLKHIERAGALKRTPRREEELASEKHVSSVPTQEEAAIAVDLMEKTLEGLDEVHAEVFRLRLQGHSERDIATRLDCTRQRVTTVLERLEKRLAKLL